MENGRKKSGEKKGNIHIYIYTESGLQKGEKWKNNVKKKENEKK